MRTAQRDYPPLSNGGSADGDVALSCTCGVRSMGTFASTSMNQPIRHRRAAQVVQPPQSTRRRGYGSRLTERAISFFKPSRAAAPGSSNRRQGQPRNAQCQLSQGSPNTRRVRMIPMPAAICPSWPARRYCYRRPRHQNMFNHPGTFSICPSIAPFPWSLVYAGCLQQESVDWRRTRRWGPGAGQHKLGRW